MISENSLRQISHIFCGDTGGLYSYKSGPKLISFFNQHFQANDQYAQGFPSRWVYVYDKLDCFVNAVYLYDDKLVITFNYKEASKTVTLKEVNGSIIECSGAPNRQVLLVGFYFVLIWCKIYDNITNVF